MKSIASLFLLILLGACQPTQKEPSAKDENWAWQNFEKVDSLNPILLPSIIEKFTCPISKQKIAWSERNVLNPAAVVKDGKVWMLFRSQDTNMTSRLGLAISDDGLHFVKEAAPVLFPAADSMQKYEWKGGVEDPRIVETNDGRYILTYTAYDGKTARLCLASSTDLIHWTKHGLVLADEKYKNAWSKSGAIVAKQQGDKMVAVQIDGKYWMYFGDTDLFMATSTDLLHWVVLENEESKKPIAVLQPRAGYFDSRLIEPGPFALVEADGIHLIYNASNAANGNDSSLPKFTYAAGQGLFNKNKPYQLIDRTKTYFMKPEKKYELVGEVNNVCFLEGLIHFQNKWFLYYGTADSKIAVAVRAEKAN